MTWVKICGITNLDDARLAVDAGADALGFIFFEGSPRNVSPEVAASIIAKLPEPIEKVGVFVNASSDQVSRVLVEAGLTAVQLHGAVNAPVRDGGPNVARKTKVYVVYSDHELQFLAGAARMDEKLRFPDAIFLDSGTPQKWGGTGKRFDWEGAAPLVAALRQNYKIVVAGGLNPGNVTEALTLLAPWGVDVASGVELLPGKKDSEKVRAFVRAIREADRRRAGEGDL